MSKTRRGRRHTITSEQLNQIPSPFVFAPHWNGLIPVTGKGVAFIIPNPLTFPDSVVVSDPHHDIWEPVGSWKPGHSGEKGKAVRSNTLIERSSSGFMAIDEQVTLFIKHMNAHCPNIKTLKWESYRAGMPVHELVIEYGAGEMMVITLWVDSPPILPLLTEEDIAIGHKVATLSDSTDIYLFVLILTRELRLSNVTACDYSLVFSS